MVKLNPKRAYTATEILALTAGEPRSITKKFRKDVLVTVTVLCQHPMTGEWIPTDWNIRCRPEALAAEGAL